MSLAGNGTWWGASVAGVLPALGLAGAAGSMGLRGTGAVLAGAAGAWLALDLLVIQPIVDRKLGSAAASLPRAARAYLQRAVGVRTVGEVAMELGEAARAGLGIDRALLLVPAGGGGVAVLGGDGSEAARVGEAEQAFLWLGDHGAPVTREDLAALAEFDGARATAELLARLDGDAALPLLHRGLLLGVALLGPPARVVPAPSRVAFLRALGAFTTVAVANTHLDVEARGQGSLSKAFDLATALQEALMPEDRTVRKAGVILRGMYRPVAECGGDLWMYQDLGRGRVLLLVADATGHGAAPAMLTAVAKGGVDAMRHVAGPELDPAELLTALNRSVHRAGRTRYLMTMFACVIDSAKGEVRFANAGQNFPYVVTHTADGRPRLEALVARGIALGAVPEATFQLHRRAFAVGERIVLYTDGIVDAGAPYAEPFGEKRFRAVLQSTDNTPASKLPELIVAEVDGYLAGRMFADDLTVVAAELIPPEETASMPGGVSRP